MSLPRMRGIAEAIEEIRAQDPNTAVTPHFLRKLVKTNAIPCIRVGTKYLVNMDNLYSYLEKGTPAAPAQTNSGTIRHIDERARA